MENVKRLLKDLNLDEKEINIYISLLKIGTSASSTISNRIGIPKSTIRYSLENLVKKGLVEKNNKGNTTYFTAEHPKKLTNILIIKKNKIENTQKRLDNIMGELIGLYNPYTKLPKVRFYEGKEGIKKVLDDSLKAKEIIDTYVDIDSVGEFIAEINKNYAEKRKKLNIKKRAIISDSKFTKEYIKKVYPYTNDILNNIKILDSNKYDLHISFMIYDGKTSYITMEKGIFVGIIIENKQIYDFHKSIFNLSWDSIK